MDMNTRIKNYWEGEAEVYSSAIQNELNGEDARIWTEIIMHQTSAKSGLDVLDIGTGPGFFPIILTKAGYNVTGIDITQSMIEHAKENLQRAHVEATLLTMDCQELLFEDNSFDLLICRNLTWTLNDPGRAYREWHRVLRPGGRLLIFDACWYLHLFDEKLAETYRRREEEIQQRFGRAIHEHNDQEEVDALGYKLFMSDKQRPAWDLAKCIEIGFSYVFSDLTIGSKTGDERAKAMNDIHRPFLVGAVK